MMALALLTAFMAHAAPASPSKVPQELLQARLEAAKEAYNMAEALYIQGKGNLEGLYRWSHRWHTAQHAVGKAKIDRIDAAEAHVSRMKALEKLSKKLVDAGVEPPLATRAARYYVAEAEVELALAKVE